MPLRLEIAGVAQTRAQLEALAVELEDMEGLWDKYAQIMSANEAEWFASEGDGLWPPLADSTLRYKESHGYPPDTLIRTEALVESLIDPVQAMDVSQGRSTLGTFTSKQMTWGTDVTDRRGREYAHYHQNTDPVTGEPAGYPPRPPERQVIPWPLPAAWRAQMEAANEEWLAEAIERSGL